MRLLKYKWFTMLLLIPLFEPAYLASIQNIHAIYKYGRIVVAIIITCLYIVEKRKSPFIAAVVLYNLALLISTLVNNGSMSEWFSSISYILTICMVVEIISRENAVLVLQILYYLLGLLTYLNFVFLLIYPHGMFVTSMYHDWGHFLANKNSLGGFLIPEIAIAALYSTARYGKLTLSVKLLIVTCFLSLVLVWSGTSLVGFVIGLLFLLLIYRKNISKYISFRAYMTVFVLLFVGIVILRVQNWFSFLIEQVLHKDLTLTGRTIIWDHSFNMINNSLLLGYGFQEQLLYVRYGELYYTGHNQLLQNMLKGGLVSTVFFVLIILLCGHRLMKCKKHDFASIISVFIFDFLVMMLTDDYGNALLFFVLLTIGYHLPAILKQGSQDYAADIRQTIIYIPQVFFKSLGDNEAVIKNFDLIKKDVTETIQQGKYYINNYQETFNRIINDAIRLDTNIKRLALKKDNLGDEKGIEQDIRRLNALRETLRKECSLEDVNKYAQAEKKIVCNKLIIDTLKDDVQKLDSVKTIIETKSMSLDLSSSGDDDLSRAIFETMIDANSIWNTKKGAMLNRIHTRIQELNEEITNNIRVQDICRESVEKYDSIISLNKSLAQKNQKLRKLLEINSQTAMCQKNLDDCIEKILKLKRRMNMGIVKGDINENSRVSLRV